jgi:hypothetical protein
MEEEEEEEEDGRGGRGTDDFSLQHKDMKWYTTGNVLFKQHCGVRAI